jgi:hypothetical protein
MRSDQMPHSRANANTAQEKPVQDQEVYQGYSHRCMPLAERRTSATPRHWYPA